MATFAPIDHRDYNARIEQYNTIDKRWDFIQLASYARIRRHPYARSPMRRQLTPTDFEPAGDGLFTIKDCRVFALIDAIQSERNYTYACANSLSKNDIL